MRDVLACLSAAVNPKDAANLFRVAALPQFAIDPVELKAAMSSVRRDELDLQKTLAKLANGAAVLADIEKVHAGVEHEDVTALNALHIVIRQFALQPDSCCASVYRICRALAKKRRHGNRARAGIS